MSKFKNLNLSLLVSVAMLNIGNVYSSATKAEEQPWPPAATSPTPSNTSSSSSFATFETFQKIRSLDELPDLLDQTVTHYGTDLTRVVFLDFDDCMTQRTCILNILDTTYVFNWLKSPERIRQIKDNVAEDLGASDKWDVLSQLPGQDIASTRTVYLPVNNLAAIIAALKARNFVVKVCSGLPADSLRLAVLEQNGLKEEDYIHARKGKALAMLDYIVEMRKKSECRKSNYMTILVDNYFPDEEEETGSSATELASTLSYLVAQTNNANSGSDKLTITSMFVNDMRFESMLAAAKPQMRTEIEHSLEATIALINIQKRDKQIIVDTNSQFAKKQKAQMKKLRHNRAKLGLKKPEKELRDVFSQRISQASSEKRDYEQTVAKAQSDITGYDQRITEFTRLLTDFNQSASSTVG